MGKHFSRKNSPAVYCPACGYLMGPYTRVCKNCKWLKGSEVKLPEDHLLVANTQKINSTNKPPGSNKVSEKEPTPAETCSACGCLIFIIVAVIFLIIKLIQLGLDSSFLAR